MKTADSAVYLFTQNYTQTASVHSSRCVCVFTTVCVCVLGWVKYREHISLLVIFCIILYVTKKNKKKTVIVFFFKTDI